MPKKSNSKNQSQNRSGRIASAHGAGIGSNGSDDEAAFNDNASVLSNASSGSFMRDEYANGTEDGAEEISQDVVFEDKLKEAMDLASQKSAAGRVNALDAISRAFCKKFIPDFVDDRRMTLTDIVERAVKKGKGSEIVSACNLCILLCLQLESADAILEVYKNLKPVFVALMHDAAMTLPARSAVAQALATTCFLSADEAETENVMASLEKIFTTKAELSTLVTAAVSSWSLLLTELPYSRSLTYLQSTLDVFASLLDSPDVDLRIAVGEAIILMFENGSQQDEEEAMEAVDPVVPKLQELSKDSHKYRSKKDRKEQKSNFRDFVKLIEDGESYYEKMSINKKEILELLSWSQKKQYDSLCKALGSGMNLHLTENSFLRDIFGLGAPIPSINDQALNRPSKLERVMANQQSSKLRTQTRGRYRDKRSAVV